MMRIGSKVKVTDHTNNVEIVGKVYSIDQDGIVTKVAYKDPNGILRIIDTIDKVVQLINILVPFFEAIKRLFKSIFSKQNTRKEAKLKVIEANALQFEDFVIPTLHGIYNNTIIDFDSCVAVTKRGKLLYNLRNGSVRLQDVISDGFITNSANDFWYVIYDNSTNVITLSQLK